MCFSEQLIDKAAGYQEEHGYVLQGYKVAMQWCGVLVPHFWLSEFVGNMVGGVPMRELQQHYSPMDGMGRVGLRMNASTRHLRTILEGAVKSAQAGPVNFRPGELVRDEDHGYHVGSNELSTRNNAGANPFGATTMRAVVPKDGTEAEVSWSPQNWADIAQNVKIREEYVVNPPGVMCRVLVPERAVDLTNHVHAMILLAPGAGPTEEQIKTCADENVRIHAREQKIRTCFDAARSRTETRERLDEGDWLVEKTRLIWLKDRETIKEPELELDAVERILVKQ